MISAFLLVLSAIVAQNAAPDFNLAQSEARCHLAETSTLALEQTPAGDVVKITPGMLHIGETKFSHCNGLPGAHPLSLALHASEVIVGFREAGAYRVDKVQGQWRFQKISGLPTSPIRALAVSEQDLWVGTGTDGLWQISGHKAPQRVAHRIVGKRGITALRAQEGRVHVGVDPTGHYLIRADGKIRKRGKAPIGCFSPGAKVQGHPPGSHCRNMEDRQVHGTALASYGGELIVASFDQGVFVRTSEGLVPIANSPRFVNALLSTKDGLYVGSAQGLFLWRGPRTTAPMKRLPLGIPSEHVNALALEQSGALWIGTSQGAARLHEGRIRLVGSAQGLPHRIVYSLATTEDGALWFGTASGVLRLHQGDETLFAQSRGSLPHDWVTSLHPVGNKVLAGTYDSGVTELAASGQSKPLSGLESAWVNPAGVTSIGDTIAVSTLGGGLWFYLGGQAIPGPRLPSTDVTDVHEHKGTIWVSTRAGLATLHQKKKEPIATIFNNSP